MEAEPFYTAKGAFGFADSRINDESPTFDTIFNAMKRQDYRKVKRILQPYRHLLLKIEEPEGLLIGKHGLLHLAILMSNPRMIEIMTQSAMNIGDALLPHRFFEKIYFDIPSPFEIPNEDGFTPIHIAAQVGNVRFLSVVLAAAHNSSRFTPEYGMPSKSILKILNEVPTGMGPSYRVGVCADPILPNILSMPLHIAVYHRQHEAAKILLKFGSNPNLVDSQDQTPLSYAVYQNDRRMIDILLERGAALNTKNSKGRTLFHLAVHHSPKFEFLMDRSIQCLGSSLTYALMEYPDNRGITPMMLAARRHALCTVEFMLGIGSVSMDKPDHQGYFPLDYALESQHYRCVVLLQALSASGRNEKPLVAKDIEALEASILAIRNGLYFDVSLTVRLLYWLP